MVIYKHIKHIVLFAIVLTVLAGCEEPFLIPQQDNTPPTVGCSIFLAGEEIVLVSGGEDVSRVLHPDVEYEISIVAKGKDANGGVKSVCINPESTLRCQSGNYVQQTGGLIAPICSSDDKKPGDEGIKRRAVGYSFKVRKGDDYCTQGYQWTTTTGSITATAENYHNGTAETAKFSYEVRAR